MTCTHTICADQKVPELQVHKLNKQIMDLKVQNPKNFTMLVFYRGLHCPICKTYLKDLDSKLSQFKDKGVKAYAISMDTQERARLAHERWDLNSLTLCYGLSEEAAKAWGLYLSQGISNKDADVQEPSLFCEPGLFLIKPDGKLYCASIQTMPFARPSFDDVLSAVDFILEKNYPPRGSFEAEKEAA